jgi:TonB-dependent receptor
MSRKSIPAAIAASLPLCTLLFTTPLQAQQPAEPAASPPAEPQAEEPEVIVVTGFRQSYIDALNTKRSSAQITDSISSDGLGRFPDLNVGEAVQRIPGIQINREADARNATISLRGLPGTFARTTLNGGGFANPVLNGSTPLGAFNSDIFTSITVIKSPTAADLAGGLSGNVDLRISPALSRKDGGFAKLSYEQNSLADLGSPQASVGYNLHLGDKLAVFGVLAYKEEKFRRDSITVNSWGNRLGAIQLGNQAAAGANPVYDQLIAQYPGGVYFPSQTRQLIRNNLGDLWTGAAGLEWQASIPAVGSVPVTQTASSQTSATQTGSPQTNSTQSGPATATRTQLPRTASQLPLIAMVGTVTLLSAASLRYSRMRRR